MSFFVYSSNIYSFNDVFTIDKPVKIILNKNNQQIHELDYKIGEIQKIDNQYIVLLKSNYIYDNSDKYLLIDSNSISLFSLPEGDFRKDFDNNLTLIKTEVIAFINENLLQLNIVDNLVTKYPQNIQQFGVKNKKLYKINQNLENLPKTQHNELLLQYPIDLLKDYNLETQQFDNKSINLIRNNLLQNIKHKIIFFLNRKNYLEQIQLNHTQSFLKICKQKNIQLHGEILRKINYLDKDMNKIDEEIVQLLMFNKQELQETVAQLLVSNIKINKEITDLIQNNQELIESIKQYIEFFQTAPEIKTSNKATRENIQSFLTNANIKTKEIIEVKKKYKTQLQKFNEKIPMLIAENLGKIQNNKKSKIKIQEEIKIIENENIKQNYSAEQQQEVNKQKVNKQEELQLSLVISKIKKEQNQILNDGIELDIEENNKKLKNSLQSDNIDKYLYFFGCITIIGIIYIVYKKFKKNKS